MTERSHLRTIPPSRARSPEGSLSDRYRKVRAATEGLAAVLSDEDCAIQSMPDASPVKWHLAHTSWFFETFLLDAALAGYRSYDPAFRILFNSYYNGVGDKHPRPERGLISRQDLATVFNYRAYVDRAMRARFAQELPPAARAVVELGLHHEQQHHELMLTDVKHLFARNPAKPVYYG